jgi:hypothetical protein
MGLNASFHDSRALAYGMPTDSRAFQLRGKKFLKRRAAPSTFVAELHEFIANS